MASVSTPELLDPMLRGRACTWSPATYPRATKVTVGRFANTQLAACPCLPTLVAHTNDPSLAVTASHMPAELIFWQKWCFLWNRYWDFWRTGSQGRVLKDKLLIQSLLKLLNCFFNHLFSELEGRTESWGHNKVTATEWAHRDIAEEGLSLPYINWFKKVIKK